MEKNLNMTESVETKPAGFYVGLLETPFEQSHEFDINSKEGFSKVFEEFMVQKYVECQTPEEYETLYLQLKNQIIDFIDFYNVEPWNATENELGVAEYIKTALTFIDLDDEFTKSDSFADAITKYALEVAPYSMSKATDLIALTSADLTDKLHQQIVNGLGLKQKLPGFTYRYEDSCDRFIAFHNLLNIYPNEELTELCLEQANSYIATSFEVFIREKAELPEWDETKIFGFDREKTPEKSTDETDKKLSFESPKDVDSFVSDLVRKYVMSSQTPSYEAFVASETKLVVFAEALGLQEKLKTIFEKDKYCSYGSIFEAFEQKYDDEISSMQSYLDRFLTREALESDMDNEGRHEEYYLDDLVPRINRSSWADGWER